MPTIKAYTRLTWNCFRNYADVGTMMMYDWNIWPAYENGRNLLDIRRHIEHYVKPRVMNSGIGRSDATHPQAMWVAPRQRRRWTEASSDLMDRIHQAEHVAGARWRPKGSFWTHLQFIPPVVLAFREVRGEAGGRLSCRYCCWGCRRGCQLRRFSSSASASSASISASESQRSASWQV
jgi:hypothetical protein